MNGTTHIALGLAAYVALGHDPLAAPLGYTLAVAAGALLPDLDHRYGAQPLKKPLPRPLAWLMQIPAHLFTHRGPLHSLLVLPLLLAVGQYFAYIPAPYGYLLALGCVAHIVADALTFSGVPLLWPLVKRRGGLPLFRTGGRIDRALPFAVLAGWLWWGK